MSINYKRTDRELQVDETFNVVEKPAASINLVINSSLDATAIIGSNNSFDVNLANLPDDSNLKINIKVRDPQGIIRYYNDAAQNNITSSTLSQSFTVMPHEAGT